MLLSALRLLAFALGLGAVALQQKRHGTALRACLCAHNLAALHLKGFGSNAFGADGCLVGNLKSNHFLLGTGHDGGNLVGVLTTGHGGQDSESCGTDHH